jgi:hypothetical protein
MSASGASRFVSSLATAVVVLASAAATPAASDPPRSVGIDAASDVGAERLRRNCAALAQADLASLPDAPTQVLDATRVAAGEAAPEHCRVRGYIRPNVRFELRLPLGGWNGKLVMEGCGGFCGSLQYAERCDERMRRGYACIVSDMGHASTPFDAKWAWNDREAEIDFGYRATHVTAVAGKALVETLYAQAPQRAYFHGCSTGGRQGLVSAQRFPADFDGIIAGAPVLRMPNSGLVPAWAIRALRDRDGRARVGPRQVEMLHAAVLQRCDARDGLADGIIGDPTGCDFDPALLACPSGAGRADDLSGCLAPPQVDAFRKVYDGPRDSGGRRLFPAGLPLGSELDWIGPLVSRDGGPPLFEGFIGDLFRYLAFAEDPGPGFALDDLDFDRDPPRLGAMARILSGADPDLREFVARGGKLLLYHGAADAVVIPEPTIDYHEMATRALGGDAAARDALRLFIVPGMSHCTGGVGAHEVDWLAALEAWVERGAAPEWLQGKRPASATERVLQRPLPAWPLRARYSGAGDPDARASHVFETVPLVVGGLRAITLTTADPTAMRRFFIGGFGMRELPGASPQEFWLERATDPAAPRLRVLSVPEEAPRLRETPSATRDGGASLSFALQRRAPRPGSAAGAMPAALARLAAAGYRSIGQFTVPLARPGGGSYSVEEFYFVGPDNLLVPVVVRPADMPSIAPIDAATGLGGPAYGGMTVRDVDAEIAFHRAVLGLELRRDIRLTEPALLRAAGLPADATVRFVQLFAPGTASGNLTLVDLGSRGERNPAPLGPASRGAVEWTFEVSDVEAARRRAQGAGGRVLQAVQWGVSAAWGRHLNLVVESPAGLRFELIERPQSGASAGRGGSLQ